MKEAAKRDMRDKKTRSLFIHGKLLGLAKI